MCACEPSFTCGRCRPLHPNHDLDVYESAWVRWENEQQALALADAYMGYGLKVQR